MPGRVLQDLPAPGLYAQLNIYLRHLNSIRGYLNTHVRLMNSIQNDFVRDEARNMLPRNVSNVLDSILQINNQLRLIRRMISIGEEQISYFLADEGHPVESPSEEDEENNPLNGFR